METQDRTNAFGRQDRNKLKDSYVITDIMGNILFRFHNCFFEPTIDKHSTFIYPVLKLVMITKGEADWAFGKNVIHVNKGDIAILRPRTVRRIDNLSGEGLELDMYEFIPAFLSNCETYELFLMESDSKNTVLKYNKEISDCIKRDLESIKQEIKEKKALSRDYIKGKLMCVIVQLARGLGLNFGENYVNSWVTVSQPSLYDEGYELKQTNAFTSSDHTIEMSRIINTIGENIASNISIDKLAKSAHMSRSHFFKVFKKYSGMSVNDYILTRRVENTVKLILETKCNVLDAAYASGFTSSSGFYKAFKKITGSTPKEYIKKKKTDWEEK